MGTVKWTGGAGDGNWDSVGNWDTGAKPVNSDDVIIGTGSISITAGLNQSGVTLTSLTITSGYSGSIGTVGTPLQISSTTVTVGGRGALYNLNGTYTDVYANIVGQVQLSIAGGTTTNLYAGMGGVVTISSSAVVTNARIGAAIVTAGYNATAFTLAEISGSGMLTSARAATTMRVDNGATSVVTGSATITTLDVSSLANHKHRSTGTITTANIKPQGGIQPDDLNASSATITNLYEWSGSRVRDKMGGGKFTVSNRYNVGDSIPGGFVGNFG